MPQELPAHERERLLLQLRRITRLMDSSWRIPGTRFRFGLDPLLGLIPGAGDVISVAVSAWLINHARRLGLPKHQLARMIANVGVDALIGAIPLLGDVFDFAFKANRRNMSLLEKHYQRLASRSSADHNR